MTNPDELHVADWKWNVWKVDKKGKRIKWLGMISDPKAGFEWLAKQGAKRSQFRINNVPPPLGRTQNPPYEVVATSATKRERGDDLPRKDIVGKTDGTKSRDRKVKSTKHYDWGVSSTAAPAPVKKTKAPKTAAEKKLEADAKVLLEQHKADEQAEMEAEKDKP